MADEKMPQTITLIASGDLRDSANQVCWEAQKDMESRLITAIESLGHRVVRGHEFDEARGHGFIRSQRQGMDVFRDIDPDAPLIVAEAVWQYSHHVLAGLTTHRGPILTVANWSGQWPGLVGLLNLNGSLTKAGVQYSSLWSKEFADAVFLDKLKSWLDTGSVAHEMSHVTPYEITSCDANTRALALQIAETLQREKAILGVFDEGCMGMFNAIIPDHLLHATGVFKERLSQSALYFESQQVSDEEAQSVRDWLDQAGMKFHTGTNHETDLTDDQILGQCRVYIAAMRIADDFGCDAIGIQYQQGLKDLLPASDLVEGMLNDSVRPPVFSRDGSRELYAGGPLTHFNEVDECAGLDGLITNRVHSALGQPVENTLHDLRWSDRDASGTTDAEVWVLEISGAVPASHFENGWADAEGFRQPPMYFPSGGSTIRGISKPGEVVWSRIFVADDRLHMDLGRATSIELPAEETQRRWDATTPQWPIMHAVLHGVSRDEMMARHKANHIQVAYANSADEADLAMRAKASVANQLGMVVNYCGVRPDAP
ncbi:L-fucose/L-arabinose isomerase family protein [Rhodopirellula baltica]|uniref:L-fucose isomerase 2 domain protein n=1 Tax=Rhodopirellula baltica WH47 TaxID=991778 RepID=F2B213_RHOBT|nr:L-fucose/L-arabinose isomerase family protein [Rhodopirellula baltica]EGF24048.1 L-fucose isomerase 2 domain protein [Rhodopirellula baltica WH47]